MSDPEPAPAARGDHGGQISPLRFISGGLEFAVTCVAGVLVGRWIDGRLGTDPWFAVALIIVSFVTATWLLLRNLKVVGAGSIGGSDDGVAP